jgi:hypothetical protein
MKEVLAGRLLGGIKKICDELLMPNVLCPWGCSCYYHEEGSCSLDSIYAKYFPGMALCGRYDRDPVESSRNDFLSSEIDCHLFNADWKIFPSITSEMGV